MNIWVLIGILIALALGGDVLLNDSQGITGARRAITSTMNQLVD